MLKTSLNTLPIWDSHNSNIHRTQAYESVLCSVISGVQSFLHGVGKRKIDVILDTRLVLPSVSRMHGGGGGVRGGI